MQIAVSRITATTSNFSSFQIMKDPISSCTFHLTTYTDNVSLKYPNSSINLYVYFLEATTWACHAGCKKFCLPSCKKSCCSSGAEPYHEGMFKDLLNYQDSLPPPPPPPPPLPGPPVAVGMPAAGQCAQGCPQTCAPSCQPRKYNTCPHRIKHTDGLYRIKICKIYRSLAQAFNDLSLFSCACCCTHLIYLPGKWYDQIFSNQKWLYGYKTSETLWKLLK